MKSLRAESALPHPCSDAQLQAGIVQARERSLAWYQVMQAPGLPTGVLRISAAHDPARWPGMLLPGTYNGLMGQALLGGLSHLDPQGQQALSQWFLGQRRENGVFRIAGMQDKDVFKKPDREETWRYIDFHVTNYSLGALQCITPHSPAVLHFADEFLNPQRLLAWLALRDLRDPWLEGNNIVNLGSFLLALRQQDPQRWGEPVAQALDLLFAWHERLQEPATGFWGVGQASSPIAALHAMAGSMHNFHLWYATGRPLPFQDKAVDFSLAQPARVHSACIDVDLVDLLVHADWQIGHRRAEVQHWLRLLLPELLAFQNPDGGFADIRDGHGVAPRQQDGWIGGYAEPQGLSNTFATWFRWIAIAMIARNLWPAWQAFPGGWQFRRMVGIGYCREPETVA